MCSTSVVAEHYACALILSSNMINKIKKVIIVTLVMIVIGNVLLSVLVIIVVKVIMCNKISKSE